MPRKLTESETAAQQVDVKKRKRDTEEDNTKAVVDNGKKQEKKKKEEKVTEKVVKESEDASSEEAKAEKKKAKKAAKAAKAAAKKAKKAAEAEEGASEEAKPVKKQKQKEEKQEEKKPQKEEKTEKVEKKVVDKKADKKADKAEKKEGTSSDPVADEWRRKHNMAILGEDCPAPHTSFAAAKFPEYINSTLKTLKFDKPTPIQSQGWPLALGGRDMIGVAETGSGKTLAFMLPGIIHIYNKTKAERAKGPSVLVLAPTRELAQQIDEVTQKACQTAGMFSCCIYGGVSKSGQIKDSQGAEIIIATPGRLIDIVENDNAIDLSNISYLVFDEADRMLDMGFEMQINQIMRLITTVKRQTLMYSATWPSDVQRLAKKFFVNPIRITIGSENLSGAQTVTQIVEVCEEYEKKKRVRELLQKFFKDNCRILIFMLYKKTCEQIGQELQREGWPCGSIHGDKSQAARNQTLADFKSGAAPIMIATDVAARGLDIKQVKYVINVEFPLKCEDYVHRIGRTGRAGEPGTAYTLFTTEDKAHARELVQIMQESNQQIDEKLMALADKAPGIKPKKTAMQQLYGDFAGDARIANLKSTRIVFD